MIERVTFKNFKGLRDVTIHLSPLTLIVGPNASGKTTILEGLDCLAQLAAVKPKALFVESRELGVLRSWGTEGGVELCLEGTWAEYNARLEFSATCGKSASWSVKMKGTWTHQDGRSQHYGPWVPSWGGPNPVCWPTPFGVLLHLDPGRLAAPSYSVDKLPQVASDGSNLASVLTDMAITDPGAFQELHSRLRAVVPSFKSLGFDRTPIRKVEYEIVPEAPGYFDQISREYVGYRLKLNLAGAEEVPGCAVSEGTLITLGLLTVLSREPVPRLVMVDGLERGLHPKALGELVRQIRALMGRFPDLQVIGTTHSPYLLDHFRPEEVRVTTLKDDGGVVVGELHEHPDLDRWKDEMKPGEFWSTVGEKWLLERRGDDAQ